VAGEYGDFQDLVDEVSALLGAPATLEDRGFRLIAFGSHDSEDATATDPVRTRTILSRHSTAEVRAWFERYGIARATGPVRIPAAPPAGVLRGRLCLPVRHGGSVIGYLWLVDETEHTPGQLAAAMEVAARIGERLAAISAAGAAAGAALRSLLTAGSPAQADTAEDALRGALGPDADEAHAIVCVRLPLGGGRAPDAAGAPGPAGAPPDPAASAPELPGLRGIPSGAALTRIPPPGGGAAGRVPHRPHGELIALLLRLRSPHLLAAARTGAAALLEQLAVEDAVAGVSAGRTSLAELPEAWREAVAAARAARVQPRLRPIARWSDLGPYRLLTTLPPNAPPDPAVAPLLSPTHRELAHTAEVFLDHAGQAGRTAAALAIHRQTLYYRLSRIEQLTGLDLSDGESRLLLHMALKAARL